MIRVLIADDHALMRGGLRQLFTLANDIEVRGEAADGRTTLEALRSDEFDLVLLDLSMPDMDGLELIARIRARSPRLPILVLTMRVEPYIVRKALRAGALGYVTKGVDPEVLLAAVRKVAAGNRYLEPAVAEKVVFQLEESPAPRHERLSAREMQVLRLWAKGMSIGEIAAALSVSGNTVSTHKARLMSKMKMGSNAELLRYALDHGLAD